VNGEDPNCSDGITFTTSISDHLNYLNYPISDSCGMSEEQVSATLLKIQAAAAAERTQRGGAVGQKAKAVPKGAQRAH
jgi:hypothetical protein